MMQAEFVIIDWRSWGRFVDISSAKQLLNGSR